MRERPILFSAPMVRAILEGRKTQTRRVVKPQPTLWASSVPGTEDIGGLEWKGRRYECDAPDDIETRCPYGAPGDRLWVKETWFADPPDDGTWAYVPWAGCEDSTIHDIPERFRSPRHCLYRADWSGPDLRWIPSIHMPRWASRITLEVTGVRVERLQDISEEDAKAEGVDHEFAFVEGLIAGTSWPETGDAKWFRVLWGDINGPDSWTANPWVWVVEFKRIDAKREAA